MRKGGGSGLRRIIIVDKEGTKIYQPDSSQFFEVVVFRCEGKVGVGLV